MKLNVEVPDETKGVSMTFLVVNEKHNRYETCAVIFSTEEKVKMVWDDEHGTVTRVLE